MKEVLAILLVSFAVYTNSLDNGFHYDDEHSIEKNIHIRDLDNIPRFFKDPSAFSVDHDKAMFRPVLLVTYALNFAWGGYEVEGYHLVNLILHALSACLVYWLARLMTCRSDLALSAGLLFAVHPICSEPVNYISSRSEGLAGFFYLAGLALFIRANQSGGGRWLYLSWGALVAGLLSKSIVFTLPAVVLVWDYLCISHRRSEVLRGRFLRWHLVYWVLAGLYLIVIVNNRFLTQSLAKPVRGRWSQFLTQIEAFAYYLKLLVWPVELNVEHQFFAREQVGPTGLLAGGLLIGLGLALYWAYRRRWDLPLFLNLWVLLALAPVVVMPLNILVNERRLYLPCAAFCLGLALLLHSQYLQRHLGNMSLGRGLSLVLILVYGVITVDRNAVWKNDFSLWSDAVAKASGMPRNHLYLGNAHKDAAFASSEKTEEMTHWEEARKAYTQAISLNSQSDLALRALNNLGAVSFVLKDIDSAEKAYRQAVEINPQYADALVNLGTIYHEKARMNPNREQAQALFSESASYYRKALRLLPNHADAWANMGLAFFEMGDYSKAIKAYERSHYLNPRNHRLLNNLGNYYATLGQRAAPGDESRRANLQKAVHYFQQSMQLSPPGEMNNPRYGLKIVEELLSQ